MEGIQVKTTKIAFIIIILATFTTGCSIPFIGGDDEGNMPVEIYNIKGTVVDKPSEEYILVGTSVITGQVRVSPVLWQQLQPGDIVDTVISLNSIISAELPGDITGKVSYLGPGYDTEGYITNKAQDPRGFAIMVGTEEISGTYYVDENEWNQVNQGDGVKVFYNLQGIQGVVPN